MNTVAALKKQTEIFLKHASVNKTVEVEVYAQQRTSRSIGWSEGKPSLQNMALDEGVCLRVLKEGAQGVVTSKNLDPEQAGRLFSEALEISRFSPKDPHRKFSLPQKCPPAIQTDPSLFEKSSDQIRDQLADLEKNVLKIDPRLKKVIKFHYYETQDISGLANSSDVSLAAESSSVTFLAEILAEDKGQTEVGWEYQSFRFADDLKMEEVADHVAKRAALSLGGTPLSTGAYSVLVAPHVGTQLLSLMTDALSAEAVQLGRSFWRDMKGKSVAASIVNLIDDPLYDRGIASVPFDDEGTPHETMNVVVQGVLKDYFYDIRSAARDNRESNGHGLKASLGAVPHPGATNFYLKPGDFTEQQLLSSEKKVFQLTDVMGLHMADPITGEFSLGAAGFLFENGRPSQPVRGVTVAGSMGALLSHVTAVGNDLKWYGSFGSPSFIVSGLTISGK